MIEELLKRFLPRISHPQGQPIFDSVTDHRRRVNLVVLSDVHLGTRSCKAEQLDDYLSNIRPNELILNGDILDLREMHKGYWPESHTAVVKRVLSLAAEGVPVWYVTGNHDEVLRSFSHFCTGNIHLVDSLERILHGKRTWIVHGDAIEETMGTPRLLRKAGCMVYHGMRAIEKAASAIGEHFGFQQLSLVRRVKNFKKAQAHISRYEETCAEIAHRGGFHAVVTGHIHQANQRSIVVGDVTIDYLNSGDWVDSLSALEHDVDGWRVMRIGDERKIEVCCGKSPQVKNQELDLSALLTDHLPDEALA